MRAADRLIVALDVPTVTEARGLIGRLGDVAGVYKIGPELLFAGGAELARELAARGNPSSSTPSCSTSARRSSGRWPTSRRSAQPS